MAPEMIIIGCALLFAFSLIGVVFAVRASSEPSDAPGASASRRLSNSHRGSRSNLSRGAESASQQSVANRLVQAGLYRRNSVSYYVVVKLILAFIPILLGVGLALTGRITVIQGAGLGIVLGVIGTIVPSFWLDAKKRRRQTNIRRALPDALDVIVVCLEAGLSLRAALSRVAKELSGAHPMLSAELMIAEREIQLGHTSGDALQHFADRFDLEELRSLSSVVKQAEKFGASVAKALRVHAEDLRVRRFQMAEERAQKANVKLLFPTMFFIFPTLYVVLLGPAVVEVSAFFSTFGK